MDNNPAPTSSITVNPSISNQDAVGAGVNAQVVITQDQNNSQVPAQLAVRKTIDMIGNEFVPRLKTEPEENIAVEVSRPSVVMSVSLANSQELASQGGNNEQPNLVYCNLNDLDFDGGDTGALTTLASNHQVDTGSAVVSSPSQQQILQMVQAVPGLQIAGTEKNPYSAVSTILLQGGILQVKLL